MPLVIPEGFGNIVLKIQNTGGGQSSVNSIALGVSTTGTFGQTEFNSLSNIMRDGLKTLWDNGWFVGPTHGNFTFGGLPIVFDDTTTEVGTHTADTYAPPQIANVVTKSTGLAGRQFRGRVYLPGVPLGSAGEDGNINPAYTTSVNAAFAALRTALIADAACDQVVLFHDSTSPGTHTPNNILSFTSRVKVATMRPRQRR